MALSSLVTEFGNNVFVISAVFGLWYAVNWHNKGLTNGSATLIKAWVCIVIAVFFRIGWWVFGLKLAPEGAIYHPFFTEWMWVTALPTAGLFTYGVLLFIDSIDRMKPKDKFINFAACMVIAALLAAI
tara:strand:+ start:131 stop:514 length:384 start_codon:yes stop_codon:yes gene_type:complete